MRLEPHHSHVLLVEGSRWGDENPPLAAAAGPIADGASITTALINGGEVAWTDVEESVRAGRPVIAVSGSGRAADDLAAAVAGQPAGERATRLAASGLLTAGPAESGADGRQCPFPQLMWHYLITICQRRRGSRTRGHETRFEHRTYLISSDYIT